MKLLLIIVLVFATGIMSYAYAESSNVSVNIIGGSQPSDSCVSAKSCYEPDTISVSPKTLVIWTNSDVTAHTVTSGKPSENDSGTIFDSGTIGPDTTYSFMFINPGTYDYFCTIHPWMTGEIVVQSATNSSNATVPEFGPAITIVFLISFLTVIFVAKNKIPFKL